MKLKKSSLHYSSSIWFDMMLILLASVAGSIDVMSYYRLGYVFTANMTGNTILPGLSIGQGKLSSSLHSLAALAGFISGAFVGALIVENTKKGWPYYITLSVAIERLLFSSLLLSGLKKNSLMMIVLLIFQLLCFPLQWERKVRL